ncbi:MAG: heat-shock protein Hsp20 [Desulfobacteraceae bacterium IS3]|nr:MAG: heat-shock protein Hsp20 [Desulfobacteraceae bacterium IS3]
MSNSLQAKEKQELAASGEQIKPGPVFIPAADIFETDKAIVLLADIPGVKTKDLNIDLRDNTLTLEGEIMPFEGADESAVLTEYNVGKYFRQFTLSEVIDQSKIDAKLTDGVLRLTLPKVGKATPRKIAVTAG